MADLATLRQQVKALYGLVYATAEDPKFTDVILNMAINEAHRHVAERTLCYRQRLTLGIPIAAHGVSSVPLDCSVIRIDDYSVQAYLNGAWTLVDVRSEQDVAQEYGALEGLPSGTPCIAYLRNGEALDAQLLLDLVPGVAAAVTGGLVLSAYIWPTLLTGDSDTPAIPPGLHTKLAKIAVWELCKLDAASGRNDAPAQLCRLDAEAALLEIERIVSRQTTGNVQRVKRDPQSHW